MPKKQINLLRRPVAAIFCIAWLSFNAAFAQDSQPSDDTLVTRDNWDTTQVRLRWAVQHFRELYPTQSVTRGMAPVLQLPNQPNGLDQFKYARPGKATLDMQTTLEILQADAFVVLRGGNVIFEEYFHGMNRWTPHFLASINKSIVASVVAGLLADGTLAETQTIETYVPKLTDSAYAGATIRQILDMLSAVDYTYAGEAPTFLSHEQSLKPEAKFLGGPVGGQEFLLGLKPLAGRAHGEGMLYKETDPAVLVWAAEMATGQRFADLTSQRLWTPLGAEFPLEVVCDPNGHWTHHLSATAIDLARWGQMLLKAAETNERSIVPMEFIQDIRTNGNVDRLQKSPLTGELFPDWVGYRSFFYRDTMGNDAIAAIGAYGQMCYLSPEHETVIVLLSSTTPWTERLTENKTSVEVFAEDAEMEILRWQLCRLLCEFLGTAPERE